MEFTIEVYKKDGRVKSGERRVLVEDYTDMTRVEIDLMVETWVIGYSEYNFPSNKYRIVVKETFVTRTNRMSGKEYQERYDTPYCCSPSSESYWSA